MVTKRTVTKKKTTKVPAARKATAATPGRVAKGTPKKKGVAAKRKPAVASSVFSLGESIAISDVLEWREKMAAAISSQDEILLDGGEIEHIDGTGLQLLVALMKEAAAGETRISWKSASDVLRNNATQLGLTEVLGLDAVSGAS